MRMTVLPDQPGIAKPEDIPTSDFFFTRSRGILNLKLTFDQQICTFYLEATIASRSLAHARGFYWRLWNAPALLLLGKEATHPRRIGHRFHIGMGNGRKLSELWFHARIKVDDGTFVPH